MDERITVCSTCNKRVADPSEHVSIDLCADAAMCRKGANTERALKGFGELTGPIIWFYSPPAFGADPNQVREAFYQQQKFNSRYEYFETRLREANAEINLYRGILLLIGIIALVMTLVRANS